MRAPLELLPQIILILYFTSLSLSSIQLVEVKSERIVARRWSDHQQQTENVGAETKKVISDSDNNLTININHDHGTNNLGGFDKMETFEADGGKLSLARRQLISVPAEGICRLSFVRRIHELSLVSNRIEKLEANAFRCVGSTLKALLLDDNRIEEVSGETFTNLERVQLLSLSNNRLTRVPTPETLAPLKYLRHLNLDHNQIGSLERETFGNESANLISLDLSSNPLVRVHQDAFVQLDRLQILSMSEIQLNGTLREFRGLSELRILHLDRGHIDFVSENFCLNSRKLTSLVLRSNRLKRVPKFSHCQNLLSLDLSFNLIDSQLEDHQFIEQPNLIDLYLGHNRIQSICEKAFTGLKRLQVLELNGNSLIKIHERAFMPLRFTLEHLDLAHNAQLNEIPTTDFKRLVSFRSFGNPKLRDLPHFPTARWLALTFAYHCCDYLKSNEPLDMEVSTSPLSRLLRQLISWALSYEDNKFSKVKSNEEVDDRMSKNKSKDGVSLSDLVVWPRKRHGPMMSLSKRQTRMIEKGSRVRQAERMKYNGSVPMSRLIDELMATRLAHSIQGLSSGQERYSDNSNTNVIGNFHFNEIESELVVSENRIVEFIEKKLSSNYYNDDHDDYYDDDEYQYYRRKEKFKRQVSLSSQKVKKETLSESSADFLIGMNKMMNEKDEYPRVYGYNKYNNYNYNDDHDDGDGDGYFHDQDHSSMPSISSVDCKPKPSAFLPCRDLFDSWLLRLGIWLIFPCAFVGNILVIMVLSSAKQSNSSSALTSIMWLAHSKRHIDVPRFLVINLAIADLLMALYLGLLAFVDISTLGSFRLFAIKWQFSSGCQLAGFLAVLSSELSVFILAIITLERNYAITNAVHLNRRLSLQKAMVIMIFGYTFAILMALMPLNGISDYRKLSVCLPIDFSSSAWSQIYVITLLIMNSLGFILLLGCYLRMYCAIRGSQAWNTNDLRIARRMSILVITDFLCWMPIILVGVTALFGHHLVDTTGIKVLTIFVLPLNSVANPFLYAITTKRFKRDLRTMLSRIWMMVTFRTCRVGRDIPIGINHDPNRPYITCQQKHHHQYENRLQLQSKKSQKIRTFESGRFEKHQKHKQNYDHIEDHAQNQNTYLQTINQVTMNKTSCYSSIPMKNVTSVHPKIVLDCTFPDCDKTENQRIASMSSDNVHYDREQKRDSINRSSALSIVRLMAPIEVRRAQSVKSCLFRGVTDADLNDDLVNQNRPISSNYNNINCISNVTDHGLEMSQDSLATTGIAPVDVSSRNDSNISIGPTRCTSAGAAHQEPKETIRFNSDDPMSVKRDRSRSPLAQKLIFSPIARAWSSLQVSIGAKSTHSQCSHVKKGDESTEMEQSTSSVRLDERFAVDNFQNMTQADRPNKLGQRRMSKSCETMSVQQSPKRYNYPSTLILPAEPTSSTGTTTTSQYDYGDRRVLLAQLSSDYKDTEYNLIGNPSRSVRCRSWSPALLDKLEGCIHHIRNRLPKLGSTTLRQQRGPDYDVHEVSSGIRESDTGDRLLMESCKEHIDESI